MENFKMSIEYTGSDGKLHKTDTDLNTLKSIPKFLKTKQAKDLLQKLKELQKQDNGAEGVGR